MQRSVNRPKLPEYGSVDAALLERACALVAEWLERAGTEDRMLALESLQVAVITTRETVSLTGLLPVEPPSFITDEQSSRCTSPGK